MIKSIEIKNYKSIAHAELSLGRINVFIGENGAGKSNILEAITLAGAAAARKLDNEFLASRGIRVTQPEFMRSAFESGNSNNPISITVGCSNETKIEYVLNNDNEPYSTWQTQSIRENSKEEFKNFTEILTEYVESLSETDRQNFIQDMLNQVARADTEKKAQDPKKDSRYVIRFNNEVTTFLTSKRAPSFLDSLPDFLVYSPENTALRLYEREGQIQPLGVNGEGLMKLLAVMSRSKKRTAFTRLKKCLTVFGWFEDFEIVKQKGRERMAIRDIFLDAGDRVFDQSSANEGFLFAAFYFALFSSELTPKFFAVDNIDASLNPKLCEQLMRTLVDLSRAHTKQAILTTHNPAILDGLNLDDDEQRLFVISRGRKGQTRIKRVRKPDGDKGYPVRLSESFVNGTLGGLPKGF